MFTPLRLLQYSVTDSLENRRRGSKFPIFVAYVDAENDLAPEKIALLKAELEQIHLAFLSGQLKLAADKVAVKVPIHATGYVPEMGELVEYGSHEVTGCLLNSALDQCEIALLAKCGFGRFQGQEHDIKAAIELLRKMPVQFEADLPSLAGTVKILAFDSNYNPEQGKVVDGMWIPFQAIGLVLFASGVLAFRTKMNYKTHQWTIERFDAEYLGVIYRQLPSMRSAYNSLTGIEFDPQSVVAASSEIVSQIESCSGFRQSLNRTCSRWLL